MKSKSSYRNNGSSMMNKQQAKSRGDDQYKESSGE